MDCFVKDRLLTVVIFILTLRILQEGEVLIIIDSKDSFKLRIELKNINEPMT